MEAKLGESGAKIHILGVLGLAINFGTFLYQFCLVFERPEPSIRVACVVLSQGWPFLNEARF